MANKINKVAVGETLAVLFCPSPDGKMFGVTVDLADLERVRAAGFWRVRNFDSARSGFNLYAYTSIPGVKGITYLHRFILEAPKDRSIEVDHQHHRNLDNRRAEIRLVSKSLNQRNKRRFQPNKFGLRGVVATTSGRFAGRVFVNGRAKYLGTFDTPELAGSAVRNFAVSKGATYAAQAVAHA